MNDAKNTHQCEQYPGPLGLWVGKYLSALVSDNHEMNSKKHILGKFSLTGDAKLTTQMKSLQFFTNEYIIDRVLLTHEKASFFS